MPPARSAARRLDPGEAAIGEAGSMFYMDPDIDLDTVFGDGSNQQGGIFGKLLGAATIAECRRGGSAPGPVEDRQRHHRAALLGDQLLRVRWPRGLGVLRGRPNKSFASIHGATTLIQKSEIGLP